MRFTNPFKHKPKEKKITEWGQEEANPDEKSIDGESFTGYLTSQMASLKQRIIARQNRPRARNNRMMKVRRYSAAGLSIFYLILGVFTIPGPQSLIFIATFYFMADYLWRTRNIWFVRGVKT